MAKRGRKPKPQSKYILVAAEDADLILEKRKLAKLKLKQKQIETRKQIKLLNDPKRITPDNPFADSYKFKKNPTGRPRKPKNVSQLGNKMRSMRVHLDDWERWKQAAKIKNAPVTHVIRVLMNKWAESVLD